MNFKNVVVAGGGVLGSQIAFQSAFHGFNVTLYDINDEALEKVKERLNILKGRYLDDLDTTEEKVEQAYQSIQFSTSIPDAAKDADIVIEAIPEVVSIKTDFYKQLGESAPEKTIFATNSSTFAPSQFKDVTGRPEKFLALHFANEIWLRNTGEVMRTEDTSDEIFNEVLDFAKAIGMVPLPIQKEQPGYILNSLLVPLVTQAGYLLGNEVADYKMIDKTWMKATNDEHGPFGMNDIVGIATHLNIRKSKMDENSPEWAKNYLRFLEGMVEEGRLGKSVGKGFYNYPNPEFKSDNFFDNPKEIKDLTHGFKNITVAGGGVLGSQIAFQTASGDFNVSLYDISDDAIEAAKGRVKQIKQDYKSDMNVDDATVDKFESNISYYTDLAEATKDADLVIEVVPENTDIKKDFYKQLSEVLNEDAYIVTNSSTLRPSDFEDLTGRPEKFAALHFSNGVWLKNTGEVMVASKTTEDTFNKILAFARDIHLVVIPIHKEQPGYILNTLLIPLLHAGLKLLVKDIANVETIDKTWMIGFHAVHGPLAIVDIIGLNTMYHILNAIYQESNDEIDGKVVDLLQSKIDKGELGRGVGKGFYDYSNGAPYLEPDFLK